MSYIIKSSKTLRLAIVSAGLVLGMAQNSAYAAGTAFNTEITNIAKLSYSVGSVTQNDICSSPTGNNISTGATNLPCAVGVGNSSAANTTFRVDNKVNLLVEEVGGLPTIVVPGATNAATTFRITNLGNAPQDYSLVASSTTSDASTAIFATPLTDNFDVDSCSARVESGTTSGFQDSEDTATFVANLAADDSKIVYVKCNVPITRIDGDVSIVGLAATTRVAGSSGATALPVEANTQSGVEIVLANPATTGFTVNNTRPAQTGLDGVGTARDAFKVESAVLTVKKVVTPICDPITGQLSATVFPKNIPGAAVQYAITIFNSGTKSALLNTITDTLNEFIATSSTDGAFTVNTACTPSPALSSGFGAVVGTFDKTVSPFVTSNYAAPGLSGQVTTAGTGIAGQDVTITYPALAVGGSLLLPGDAAATPAIPAGTLAPAKAITVYFNVFIK